MYIENINGAWVFVPDSYDPTPTFTRTAGPCDKLRYDYTWNDSTIWLRSPTERCIASTSNLAHAILGVYNWLGRPTRDYQQWNIGSSPPAITRLMKAANISACHTQHCENGYAIAFATAFPVEEISIFNLESPYKMDIFQSEEDIDRAFWGWFGYFLFTSIICTDPAWPPEA